MHLSPRRFLFLVICLTFTACMPALVLPSSEVSEPGGPKFYALRLDPLAILQFSADLSDVTDHPLGVPSGCTVWGAFPATQNSWLALELLCADRSIVQVVNLKTGEIHLLLPADVPDSHFLAWDNDRARQPSLYLEADALVRPRIYRSPMSEGQYTPVDALPPFVYHLDTAMDKTLWSLTRGLGYGSELWVGDSAFGSARRILADPQNIITFARWSPDGKRITFVKMPDSQAPFPAGEVWVMDADGTNSHFLSAADAGHGYAPAWSPDGGRIAFVVRENPDDAAADRFAENLRTNLYVYDLGSNTRSPLTQFPAANVGGPVWSPDGAHVAFDVRMDDKITTWLYDVSSGMLKAVTGAYVCCPFWLSGK
jgi:Tol biopolymer transport system component